MDTEPYPEYEELQGPEGEPLSLVAQCMKFLWENDFRATRPTPEQKEAPILKHVSAEWGQYCYCFSYEMYCTWHFNPETNPLAIHICLARRGLKREVVPLSTQGIRAPCCRDVQYVPFGSAWGPERTNLPLWWPSNLK